MILREFKESGIQAFREYLATCRSNSRMPPPREMLEDDRLTVSLGLRLDVEPRPLWKKADAANYLATVLGPLDERQVLTNSGLWTWLTLYFFDSVCPPSDGKRTVKNDYHYVFEPKNTRHSYLGRLRHSGMSAITAVL